MQFLDISFTDKTEQHVALGDVADFHDAAGFFALVLEGYGQVIGTVQFFTDNAGADRKSVV